MKGWSNTDSSHHCCGDRDAQSGCLRGRKQSRGGSWYICSFCPLDLVRVMEPIHGLSCGAGVY